MPQAGTVADVRAEEAQYIGTRLVIPRVDAQTPPTIVCVTLRRRPIVTGAMAAKNRRMAGNSKLRTAAAKDTRAVRSGKPPLATLLFAPPVDRTIGAAIKCNFGTSIDVRRLRP